MAMIAVIAMAGFAFWYFYLASRHMTADPAVGRVLLASNHGKRFYLTETESRGLRSLLAVFVFSAMLAILFKVFPSRKEKAVSP
jgi:hypothetical protein